MNIDALIKILQASIAPVVLISGVGLLLLSMTNRLGRSIDRIRQMCSVYENAPRDTVPFLEKQIDILYARCQMLRIAIALATLSIICISLIVLALFSIYVVGIDLSIFVEIAFAGALLSLIASMFFFFKDIRFALSSLKIEIEHTYKKRK